MALIELVNRTIGALRRHAIPVWFKAAYTLLALIVVPIYWQHYGPANFLWFSDIAFLTLVPVLWLGSPLWVSMMAIGVMAFEIGWLLDFLSGGRILGLTFYMFEDAIPLYLRALSLFHLLLPPLMIWLLARDGYDRRAFVCQTLLAIIILPLTYWVADPKGDNINWVFGLGTEQHLLPPLLYLALWIAGWIALVFWPSHLLLKRVFWPSKYAG